MRDSHSRRLTALLGAALLLIAVTVVFSSQAYAASGKAHRHAHRPRCSDHRDNDGDGLIDYPKDPGCKSRRDDSEYNKKRRRRNVPTPTPKPVSTPRATPTAGPVSGNVSEINTGVNSSLKGHRPFPDDNPWNTDISNAAVDPNSDNLIASIGLTTGLHPDFGTYWQGAPIGEDYLVVAGNQPRVAMSFQYASESDPGPYPMPLNSPIEGGASSTGDRHVIVLDKDNWVLYETWDSHPLSSNWQCGSGAVFNLNSNDLRPEGWTSADAAGLPIFPGLVRYDEVVEQGEIRHAVRFTVQNSRRAHVFPARHSASSSTSVNLPPMGMRVRLKASFDISRFSPHVQVILRALKKYGMIVADNGSNWYIAGAHDDRWNDSELAILKEVQGRNFEVVRMGAIIND